MNTTTRIVSITAILLSCGTLAMKSAPAPDREGAQGHLSGFEVKITLPDGSTRLAKLDGLGCTSSICSRVAIKGKVNLDSPAKFWLDGVAAIKDVTQSDALVVMKDGAEQRMRLITDFRVLYLGNRSSRTEKLDLTGIKSLEFLPSQNRASK